MTPSLVLAPASILSHVTEAVYTAEEAQQLLSDLERVADQFEASGQGGVAGLAAPQIGVSKSAFIYKRGGAWAWVVNPEIVGTSKKTTTETEGCLSLPSIKAAVERPMSIRAVYYDVIDDELCRVEGAFGVPLARVFQHEYDHLNGVLITDRGKVKAIRNV